MLKKIVVVLVVAVSALFAQDVAAPAPTETQYEDVSAYTSGAPAPETPVVNINEVRSSDPIFYLSLHPITLFVFSLIDAPMVYLTFEGCISNHFSVITRPMFFYFDEDADNSSDGASTAVDLYVFGLTEGLRFYFNDHPWGLYVEPEFDYRHYGLDYEHHYASDWPSDDREDDYSASAEAFGFTLVVGHKYVKNHFTTSFDVGYGYLYTTATDDEEDDVDTGFSSVGFGWDMNFTMGYAF